MHCMNGHLLDWNFEALILIFVVHLPHYFAVFHCFVRSVSVAIHDFYFFVVHFYPGLDSFLLVLFVFISGMALVSTHRFTVCSVCVRLPSLDFRPVFVRASRRFMIYKFSGQWKWKTESANCWQKNHLQWPWWCKQRERQHQQSHKKF